MATVTKRGDKWYAIYQDHSGKWRQRVGYYDKTETLRFARGLEDEARKIRVGDVDPQAEARRIERSKHIETQIAEYKTARQARGLEKNHVDYTVRDIKLFVEFSGVKNPNEITRAMMDRFVEHRKADGDSNSTINRRVKSNQAFLKRLASPAVGAVTQYVLLGYPYLPTGQAHQKRTYRALADKESDKLTSKTKDETRQFLYAFALKSGLRLGEIRDANASFFDFRHKIIVIPAHVAKSRVSQIVPLHPDLAAPLKKMCAENPEGPLFKIPATVNSDLRADCRAAGVNAKNVSFHSLRHTFCTRLARANVHPALLQKLARHAKLETTLKYYVHLQRSDEYAAICKLA